MSEKEINQGLAALRQQIDGLATSDSETREKLQGLLNDLEHQVNSLEAGEQQGHLIEDIKGAIAEFEAQHPRLTGILNDIMIALGNLGI